MHILIKDKGSAWFNKKVKSEYVFKRSSKQKSIVYGAILNFI
jgi:hypothetical protein